MRRTAILFIAALLLAPCLAQADIAEIMSYQGVLRDSGGNPVPDDDYMVRFMIYDVETGGAALWIEDQTLTATGGIINAHLGSVVSLTTLEFDVPYWLGITIEHGAELVPRTAFTTVPYAAHAGFADTCLEGDDDWQISGDNVYHDVGNVGIGTVTPTVKLDVVAGEAPCARFENGAASSNFTVRAVNSDGTAGGYFAGVSPSSYPGIPAAVFGHGGAASRGAHFISDGHDALFAASSNGKAVWGYSSANYSGYFSGGGLGVYVADQLETKEFKMLPGSGSGHVLTSDGSGVGTWQPAAGGSDSDWTIAAGDMYSAVPGRVGIGTTSPTAKLEIYNSTSEEVLEVKHDGSGAGRAVNMERISTPSSGQDLLQLKVPSDSPDDCQFIECERGSAINFRVDGDGSITAAGKLTVDGTEQQQAEFSSSASGFGTRVVSAFATGSSESNATGFYGESIAADGRGIGCWGKGGYLGVHGEAVGAGSEVYGGVYGSSCGGSGTNYGLQGYAASGATNYGVYASVYGSGYAGYFDGDVQVTETLTAGAKYFKIDHPLDPENKYLVHSCVESDEMMNIYNGNVTLDARGEATVEMPEWFEALNQDFRYQLTAIGAPGPNLYVAEEIGGNCFQIAGGEPGMKVSWLVTGVRHDPLATASRMLVEQDKPANEVGKYMHPEAYGMPRTAGVDYQKGQDLAAGGGPTERAALEAFDPNDGE